MLFVTWNMWIVPLSEEQAIQCECLSKAMEYISALSLPLRTSCNGSPVSVEKILIRVPLSLAVASNVPAKLSAMQDKEL